MNIKRIDNKDTEQVRELVLEVFMQFEAPDYSDIGVRTFKESAVENDSYMASLAIYGAYMDNELAGVIATRNEGKHIALFFVKAKYHRQGVGRALFETVRQDSMTVNSSPYAQKVYEHLGFIAVDSEKTVDGIRFVPMKYCEKNNT